MRNENEFIANASRVYSYGIIKTANECGFHFADDSISEEVCDNVRLIMTYLLVRDTLLKAKTICDMEIYDIARHYGWTPKEAYKIASKHWHHIDYTWALNQIERR